MSETQRIFGKGVRHLGRARRPGRNAARLSVFGERGPLGRLARAAAAQFGNPAMLALLLLGLAPGSVAVSRAGEADADVQKLRTEVADKGWLVFSAKNPDGDYDLFLSRPDGSEKRNLTQTAESNEFGGRFSPDGKRMLFRRAPKPAVVGKHGAINHDSWGTVGELVIANADGSNPQAQGGEGEYPWACWSPDGKQISCLYRREGQIRIFDLETKALVKEMPRQGIFQQLFWSGDGARFCGTANLQGRDWNIVSMDIATGNLIQVSRNLACTPDWFETDPNRIVFSCRTPGVGGEYGATVLMQGSADGKSRSLIYGEVGHHIYYGCMSPDDKYVIFARPESDGGTDAEMVVMRLADAPIVVPADFKELLELYPTAKTGPVLHMGQPGFEPHWTYAQVGGK